MNEHRKAKDKICCTPSDDVICSIALEEASLAHILNAEGEKIQKAIETTTCIEDLLRVNCSVQNTIISVTGLENVLFNKLRILLQDDCECCCPDKKDGALCIHVCSCNTKKPLPGICIKVYNEASELIDSKETDENGKYCLSHLQHGNYKVVLVNKKTCEEECFDFSICETQKCFDQKICFKTCFNKTISIKGIVMDCNGNKLCNATVTAEGICVEKSTTDECGMYEIKNLTVDNCFSVFAECNGISSETYKNQNPIYKNYSCNFKIKI